MTLAWALWWGGLSFYAGIAVPTGTQIVGSDAQGRITQRVTTSLNVFGAVSLTILAVEAFRRRKSALIGCTLTALACQAFLFFWHGRLAQLVATGSDGDAFYRSHQVYLWVTMLQWVCGLVLAAGLVSTGPPVQGRAE